MKEDKNRGSMKRKLTATCNELSFSSVTHKTNTHEHLLQYITVLHHSHTNILLDIIQFAMLVAGVSALRSDRLFERFKGTYSPGHQGD